MPNEKVLMEKKKIVEDLTEKLRSQAGVFVNYSGISVVEDTELRVKMREAKVDYAVIKNTLMRFAIKNVGYDELDPILNGTTSLAVSKDDPIAPARIIKEYADKLNNYFEIKGGFMDGKVLSVDEVNALASIPALPILQAQLLGTMLAPIASLAVVLKAIAEKGGAPVDAEVKVPETPAEEAPAAAAPVEAPAEPVAEAVAEPVVEAVAEPVAEAAAEPVTEAAAKPVTEAVAEPVAEAVAEPVVEAVVEPVVEAVAEPVAETVAEPVAEAASEDTEAEAKKPAAKKAPAKKAKPADTTAADDTTSAE